MRIWIIGVFLLLMTLGMAFTGQVMRFDQDAYWRLGIGASIAQPGSNYRSCGCETDVGRPHHRWRNPLPIFCAAQHRTERRRDKPAQLWLDESAKLSRWKVRVGAYLSFLRRTSSRAEHNVYGVAITQAY
jgi:hypothetical protein